jgi:hypothetical protein
VSCAVLGLLGAVRPTSAGEVSFRNDVMAVLSKGGCNQGVCHGNQNGKNGFRLSLRGQDPAFDYTSLTRDMLGRRTNRQRPTESLLLLKATARIPHEGGRRFGLDSPEHEILERWIAAGLSPDPPPTPVLRLLTATPPEQVLVAPADRVPLRVRAAFSDGSVRDVTRLAVYEPSNPAVAVTHDGTARRVSGQADAVTESVILVRYLDRQAAVRLAFVPARPDFRWQAIPEANYVDRLVFARLRVLRIQPSAVCADAVFLRRAYLDTLGLLPSPDEVRRFLTDERPEKRARLVDRLLGRPEFADFWALKWSDLLRNEEKVLDAKGVRAFHRWIRDNIARGRPVNEFARDLIAARGSTYTAPAANFYRALRDPEVRAEVTAQVFLGVRLQCARCHNHPFDRWTQDDYYRLTAFFPRVRYKIVSNRQPDGLDTHQFDGEQIVWQARHGEVRDPRTGAVLRPRFLGGPTPDAGPEADRLQLLADWVAAPDNPFFGRAQINRIWFHLLGRGLVEPNDDFRASNPAANEPLLDALARDFAVHHFDLRHLIRTVMTSRTYQLAALPNDSNRADEANFSHALVRPLQAEQLADALAQVTGVPVKFNGYPLGTRAGELAGSQLAQPRGPRPTSGDQFLRAFGKPERLLACECERSTDTTLGEAFQLITGELINRMLSTPDNRIGRLLADGKTNREMVDEFYLAALSRPPSAVERRSAEALLANALDRRAAIEDFVWALVNAKEFLLRQ